MQLIKYACHKKITSGSKQAFFSLDLRTAQGHAKLNTAERERDIWSTGSFFFQQGNSEFFF